jgi:hypothetical protein
MKFLEQNKWLAALGVSLMVTAGITGCATKQDDLPPMRVAAPARSPEEVLQALPGRWEIDVVASAEVMARQQFQPRATTVLRREGMAAGSRQEALVADQFDPDAYQEARKYWAKVLSEPEMQWRLTFKADGTGGHLAVVETGKAPEVTPFTWKLDGWRLSVSYPEAARFKSFEVEAPSAIELNYPMHPLGDHLVLRRRGN